MEPLSDSNNLPTEKVSLKCNLLSNASEFADLILLPDSQDLRIQRAFAWQKSPTIPHVCPWVSYYFHMILHCTSTVSGPLSLSRNCRHDEIPHCVKAGERICLADPSFSSLARHEQVLKRTAQKCYIVMNWFIGPEPASYGDHSSGAHSRVSNHPYNPNL